MISEWKGKWALVTGASAGIGVALAEELAAGGTHLVLTARRLDRLQEIADGLRKKHGIQTHVVAADLAKREAPQEIYAFTKEKGLRIDLLINNAGFGQYGEVPQVETQRLLDMVEVNCTAVVHLTRLFVPEMVARRRHFDSCFDGRVSGRAVYFHLCRDQGVRSLLRGRFGGGDEAARDSRLRVVPRLDGIGISRGCGPGEVHRAESGARGQGGADRVAGARRREELRHLRIRQLSGGALAAAGAAPAGDPRGRKHVSPRQESTLSPPPL